MNSDLFSLLKIMTCSKPDIYDFIKPKKNNVIYYDNDSEDEGTSLVEAAFLMLCLEIFSYKEGRSKNLESQLNEMGCVINYALDLSDMGQTSFFLNSENSYDLFWDIMKRYSSNIIKAEKTHNIDAKSLSFEYLLIKYGFSLKYH